MSDSERIIELEKEIKKKDEIIAYLSEHVAENNAWKLTCENERRTKDRLYEIIDSLNSEIWSMSSRLEDAEIRRDAVERELKSLRDSIEIEKYLMEDK